MSESLSPRSIFQNFEIVSDLEWLEPNGLGGWASSTISGANTRKYHGLLITAHEFSDDRFVLVSGFDETVWIGEERFDLGCHIYPGAVHPKGYNHLKGFSNELFPEFIFQIGDVQFKKTIATVKGRNITLVQYELLKNPQNLPVRLEVHPLLAVRNHHLLRKATTGNELESKFRKDTLVTKAPKPFPDVYIKCEGSQFKTAENWYYNFEYPRESERGEDYQEDLVCPGNFQLDLHLNRPTTFTITTEKPQPLSGPELMDSAKQQKIDFLNKNNYNDYLVRSLFRITDQFVIRKKDDNLRIKSGFFWFTESSRETMIAVPGILLIPKRFEEAKEVLRKFAHLANGGLIPNQIPYPKQQPVYTAIDAGLWMVNAIYKYIHAATDPSFGTEPAILGAVETIINGFYSGTALGGKVGEDKLIDLGNEPTSSTWMGIQGPNGFVTPRGGKVVEVNALWYNALKVYEYLLKLNNRTEEAKSINNEAATVKKSFVNTFWDDSRHILYDYVTDAYNDLHVRPNQVLALGLPHPVVDKSIAIKVLQTVRKHLLTPVGLRSLSHEDPAYKARYLGNQYERDNAYHQGSVWPWLLGPYIDAVIRFEGIDGEDEALDIYNEFDLHLNEAGVTCISEIFDAVAPHMPRGCISYACSVAELLRAGVENNIFDLEEFSSKHNPDKGDKQKESGQKSELGKFVNPFSSGSAFRSSSRNNRAMAFSKMFNNN